MRFGFLIAVALVAAAAGPVHAKCARSTSVDADCYEGGGKDSAHSRRGRELLAAKNYAAAIDAFTKAIALDPSATANYNNRANAYDSLKAYDKAIADYTTAIRLAPREDVYLFNRAATLGQMQDYGAARADLLAALAINPKSWVARQHLATVNYLVGEYQEAVDLLTDLLRQKPRDGPLLVSRGRAFREMNQLGKALADLQCAAVAVNDPSCFATRADVHRLENDLEKAWADVETALRLNPKSALALRVRADLKALQGEDLAAVLDYARR
jgi:tetratricopeptide (TPR) repeat protein